MYFQDIIIILAIVFYFSRELHTQCGIVHPFEDRGRSGVKIDVDIVINAFTIHVYTIVHLYVHKKHL